MLHFLPKKTEYVDSSTITWHGPTVKAFYSLNNLPLLPWLLTALYLLKLISGLFLMDSLDWNLRGKKGKKVPMKSNKIPV